MDPSLRWGDDGRARKNDFFSGLLERDDFKVTHFSSPRA
jgi:hypothetical protein